MLTQTELFMSLSRAIDLGMGQPLDWVLRSSLIGQKFVKVLGLSQEESRSVYYAILLRHVGCTSTAQAEMEALGNEVAAHKLMSSLATDRRGLASLYSSVSEAEPEKSFISKLKSLGAFFWGIRSLDFEDLTREHCEIAQQIAKKLGLPEEARLALDQSYEYFDGTGLPKGLKGDEITISSQVASFSLSLAMFAGDDAQAILGFVKNSSGTKFAPRLCSCIEESWSEFESLFSLEKVWDRFLALSGTQMAKLDEEGIFALFEVFAEFSELKNPIFLGHGRRVADLVKKAGTRYLPDSHVREGMLAAHLIGLGRIGISNIIWTKKQELTQLEYARVKNSVNLLHEVFPKSSNASYIAQLASQVNERLDGSGYPRGLKRGEISPLSGLLAVCHQFVAMTSHRPHRPALPAKEALDQLVTLANLNCLDHDAVNAITMSLGRDELAKQLRLPFDLTPREIDVLRLICKDMTNKEMAGTLAISAKTVGHHIERLYQKIGVQTRAGATLFALRNGLV